MLLVPRIDVVTMHNFSASFSVGSSTGSSAAARCFLVVGMLYEEAKATDLKFTRKGYAYSKWALIFVAIAANSCPKEFVTTAATI
jgi:hypothetical protein